MASTVVRVEKQTHERLRVLAAERSRSIGQVIAELVEKEEVDRFWTQMRTDYDRLAADPEAMADYQREVEDWQSLTGDSLADEPAYYTPDEEEEIRASARSQGW